MPTSTRLHALGTVAGWFVAVWSAIATPPLIPSSPQPLRHAATNYHSLRACWAHDQRAFPLGYVPADARVRALQQIQQSQALQNPPRPLVGGSLRWVNIGPAPIVNGQIAPAGPVTGR